jgi:hypothetical protein
MPVRHCGRPTAAQPPHQPRSWPPAKRLARQSLFSLCSSVQQSCSRAARNRPRLAILSEVSDSSLSSINELAPVSNSRRRKNRGNPRRACILLFVFKRRPETEYRRQLDHPKTKPWCVWCACAYSRSCFGSWLLVLRMCTWDASLPSARA